MIIYTLIAKGSLVLVEYTEADGDFPQLVRKILVSVKKNQEKQIFSKEEYVFCILSNGEYKFITMIHQNSSKEKGFRFLEAIRDEYLKDHEKKDYSNSKFTAKICQMMQGFNKLDQKDALSHLEDSVDDLQNSASANLMKMIWRLNQMYQLKKLKNQLKMLIQYIIIQEKLNNLLENRLSELVANYFVLLQIYLWQFQCISIQPFDINIIMNNRFQKNNQQPSDQGSIRAPPSHFNQTQQQGFQDGLTKQIPEESVDPKQIVADSMFLNFSGILECGECEDEETLRIEYSIKYGIDDWEFLKQDKEDIEPGGMSQLSTSRNLHSRNIVWNFPFECNFKTKNIFGWPQVVVRLSGPDFLGRSVAKGYGSVHVPTQPGYHERTIRVFKPLPTSGFTGFLGFLLGNTAELKNFDKVIASGEGREVTRVKSVGYVKIKFHVTLVNFDKFGYQ